MRFGASTASWNTPIKRRAVGYDDYPRRLTQRGFGPDKSAAGKLMVKLNAYSVSYLDAADADNTCPTCKGAKVVGSNVCSTCKGKGTVRSTARVAQAKWAQDMAILGVAVGTEIPWSTKWAIPNAADPSAQPNMLPAGTDRCVVIVDYKTRKAWELWRAAEPHASCVDGFTLGPFKFGGPNTQAGFVAGNPAWVGAASCTAVANIDAATDSTVAELRGLGRGMGIYKQALTIRASELEAGVVEHAIPLTVSNPMYGPLASPPVGNSDPRAGITRGFWVPPATKLEHSGGVPSGQDGSNTMAFTDTLPSGMRFGLDITDAAIESWLDWRGFVGAKRLAAKAVAVAMRVYGMIVAETGGWGIGVECESCKTPVAAAAYARMGMLDSNTENPGSDLLFGLWNYGTIYVAAY